jgi:enoyl-CoA hydratase
MAEYVTTSLDAGAVATVTIDRPPVNALNVELIEQIVAAFEALHADPPAAVVLAGRENVFSAGADLKALPGATPEYQRASVHGINAMARSGYSLPCPVVGAITGHAIAGGFVLALCADFRIGTESGRHGLTEIAVGVPYPQAAMDLVRAELPPAAARKLVLGAELTDSADCLALGVFDELAPDSAAALRRAREIASRLAGLPADVYARTKLDLRAPVLERMRAGAAEDPLLARWVSA